jgi:hypothetical protein
MNAYIAGCLVLACMAGLSLSIVVPGLALAIRIVAAGIAPRLRWMAVAVRAPSSHPRAETRPTTEAARG